ncbi:hypothetical protein GLW20_01685 [Virgibacillus halodenitrificans]|nr:hypothetical protein [Virgibacillus halodenitrificans]
MRNFHVGTRGWSDIGQHTTIGKNGDVILGRNIKIMPASAFGHNGSTNWHPFMFEMIGDFDKGRDRLDGDQLETVMEISKYFYNKGKKIRFHREMDSRKSCPGTGISKSWFMNQVKSNSYTPPKTETKPETVTKPKWNKVTGSWTGQTLRKYDYGDPVGQLQLMLSNNNPPFYPNKGAKNNGIDDYYGDDTTDAVRRFQSYYGLKLDGLAGKEVYGQLGGKKPSKPTNNKKYVYLPSSAKTWRTYKLNVQPVKKNSDWSLTPARYGGLKYEILDEPYPNVVTIKTGRGKRNIYVGPGTSAEIK